MPPIRSGGDEDGFDEAVESRRPATEQDATWARIEVAAFWGDDLPADGPEL